MLLHKTSSDIKRTQLRAGLSVYNYALCVIQSFYRYVFAAKEIVVKRTIWNVTMASLLTLVAYVALYFIWGAILNELADPVLQLFVVASMTTAAFGYMLLHTSKKRKAVGEDEVISDYKDKPYISVTYDLKCIMTNEKKTIICVAVIVLAAFLLNTFDSVVFGKKTISFITFFYTPMYIFDALFSVPFVGYLLSAVLDCAFYIFFLLLYRKKKYDYWMKSKV